MASRGSFRQCRLDPALRTGAFDAAILADQIGLGGPGALLDLANGEAWARLLLRGVPTSPVRLNLFNAPSPRRSNIDRLIETSRMRFGRPRGDIEARIYRFLETN